MKKISIHLLIVLFTANYGFSQTRIDNDVLNPFTAQQRIHSTKSNVKNIKGSPYLNAKFLPVKVDKLEEKQLSGRYNAFSDEIEIKKQNSSVIFKLNKKSKFSKVQFLMSKVVYAPYDFMENGKSTRGYLAQLNQKGPALLLKKQSIAFIDAQTSNTGYDQGVPAQFRQSKDKYFIKTREGNIVEIQKNKKDLAKLFPKYEKELLSFIKKQGISTKKETDLIKFINYLNSLN